MFVNVKSDLFKRGGVTDSSLSCFYEVELNSFNPAIVEENNKALWHYEWSFQYMKYFEEVKLLIFRIRFCFD